MRKGEPETVLAGLWLGHRSNGDLGPLPGLHSGLHSPTDPNCGPREAGSRRSG